MIRVLAKNHDCVTVHTEENKWQRKDEELPLRKLKREELFRRAEKLHVNPLLKGVELREELFRRAEKLHVELPVEGSN